MQTTLLGLAIAFIIALIAALVGPHFIDWNQFRPQFEAEASRALGAPVKVDGLLDARLLPTPTLHLQSVTVGGADDARKISADKLDVEFSLSAAMRGEWRATELSLDGFAADAGLDKQGRVEVPLSGGAFNFNALTIDRLNVAGRINLYDRASGASRQLDDFKFSGDVRALAGTTRGEGSFVVDGVRAPFRVSSGQSSDGKGTRVRLSLDPGDRPLFADLDGALTFDALAPKFDGTLTLARPEEKAADAAQNNTPWRVTSHVKSDASSATLEQVEAVYGPEDSALRLAGSGDIRFGASPLLHLALSSRQLDVDRLLNKSPGDQSGLLSKLRGAAGQFPALPIPTQLELNVDQIGLGGKPLQNFAVEARADKSAWTFAKFEMRAPGATQISASGVVSSLGTHDAAFKGPVSVDASDPAPFFAWLQRRSDVASATQKPIRLRGTATVAADRVVFDDLKADLDSGALTGRVAISDLPNDKTRLEAALKSDNFNLDTATGLFGTLAGPNFALPDEAKISLDVGKVVLAGQDIRPVALNFLIEPNAISLDRLNIGDSKSFTVNGSGSFDRVGGNGKFSLAANASSLERIGSVIAPVYPALADRLKAVDPAPGDVRVQLNANLETMKDRPQADANAGVDIDAPQIKGSIVLKAAPPFDSAHGIDLGELARGEVSGDIKLTSDKSSTMLALFGLDRILSAQDGGAQFDAKLIGPFNATSRVTAKLSGAGFDGDIGGTVERWIGSQKSNFDLSIRTSDASPLFDTKPGTVALGKLSSRVSMSGEAFALDDLDAVIGPSHVKGRMNVTRADDVNVSGDISIDAVDLAPVVAIALGTAGRDSSEPSGRGLLRGWRGSLDFQSAKVQLPGGGELGPFAGKVTANGQSLALEGKGGLGGGEFRANADARQSSEGTQISASANAADIDGAALRYRGVAMPESKTSFQISLASQGRSASALQGAMSGAGVVTLKNLRMAGLDPGAFEAGVRASDSGQPVDDANLKSLVEPTLSGGPLVVQGAQVPFTIKDGRIRVEPTALDAPRTRATISGGYDITSDQMDARIVLSAAVMKPATRRPEIRIDFNGTPDAPVRSVDVASLSSWLMLRSIDRQTQQLDRLDSGDTSKPEPQPMSLDQDLPQAEPLPKAEVKIPKRDPRKAAKSTPAAPLASAQQSLPASVPPLPPATTVKPAPGAAKPRAPVALTPPASGTSF